MVQTKGATDGVIYFDSVRVVEKAVKTSYTVANLLTVYAYDNNGNLKTVTNKDNRDGSVINATASEYNALGLITKVLDPLSRVTEYEYSESGKLVST